MELKEKLRQLLQSNCYSTQDALCEALHAAGWEVNQSKISRLLHSLKAIKIKNERGELVYSLPKEPAPSPIINSMKDIILDIVHNEQLIVIYTTPGSAGFVARLLDYRREELTILGTIAGDDTIMIAPRTIKQLNTTLKSIQQLLKF